MTTCLRVIEQRQSDCGILELIFMIKNFLKFPVVGWNLFKKIINLYPFLSNAMSREHRLAFRFLMFLIFHFIALH